MAPVGGGVGGEELRATAAGVSRGFVGLVGAVSVWFVGKKRFVLCSASVASAGKGKRKVVRCFVCERKRRKWA
jgi:hypothetical protein